MSKPSRRPVSIARWAICTGVWPATIGRLGTCACSASCANCSCAAGRWVSRLASSTRRRSRSRSRSASLPDGGGLAGALQADHQDRDRRRRVQVDRDGALAAQRLDHHVVDDLDDLLAGRDRGQHLGARPARSRTLAMKSRTTGSATSASSSARRTSRSASVTSASDSAPRPRSRSNTPDSLSDSASNTATTPNGQSAAARTLAERRSPRVRRGPGWLRYPDGRGYGSRAWGSQCPRDPPVPPAAVPARRRAVDGLRQWRRILCNHPGSLPVRGTLLVSAISDTPDLGD